MRPKQEIAKDLYGYMSYRADQEGQEHTLTVEWYRRHLMLGVECFFGILVDGDGIVSDEQSPETLNDWLCFLDRVQDSIARGRELEVN